LKNPIIKKECVKQLLDTKYAKVFDLQYKKGCHYYDATRRELDDIIAIKSDDEYKRMLPDATTSIVIIKNDGQEPKLLLTKEYRYPAGRFMLSPPAGLLDEEDKLQKAPLICSAKREIYEETGAIVKDTDKIEIVSPLIFSSPGLSDECNAIVCAVIDNADVSTFNNSGAVGTELFDGIVLLNREEVRKILKNGMDNNGYYYSTYTEIAMLYFISGLWE